MVQVQDPWEDHVCAVDLVGQVHLDLEDPYLEGAFFAVSHPAEDPSSSWDRDFVANAEDVEDAVDAVGEVALVADADVDYGVADFDFAEELELDVFCTETRIGSVPVWWETSLLDSVHVILSWAVFPCISSCFVPSPEISHKILWIVHLPDSQRISLLQSRTHQYFVLHLLCLDRSSTKLNFQHIIDDAFQFGLAEYYSQVDDMEHYHLFLHLVM